MHISHRKLIKWAEVMKYGTVSRSVAVSGFPGDLPAAAASKPEIRTVSTEDINHKEIMYTRLPTVL